MPLLHAVPMTARSLDGRMLGLGFLVAVAGTVWIWFPDHARQFRRGVARAGVARCAAMVMLLLAVLPSVVPYDHLFGHVDMSPAETAVHAAHCHGSPGSCADAPVTSGPGQFLVSGPLLIAPALQTTRVHTFVASLAGRTVPPDVRPPQA
jgi:hypothetical protein